MQENWIRGLKRLHKCSDWCCCLSVHSWSINRNQGISFVLLLEKHIWHKSAHFIVEDRILHVQMGRCLLIYPLSSAYLRPGRSGNSSRRKTQASLSPVTFFSSSWGSQGAPNPSSCLWFSFFFSILVFCESLSFANYQVMSWLWIKSPCEATSWLVCG